MQIAWDYGDLATPYLHRPSYAPAAIAEMLAIAGAGPQTRACDVGAGTALLTVPLAACCARVVAVEPNDAMLALGAARTAHLAHVAWTGGAGERTGQPSDAFDLVTFGSSFNVTDRPAALRETRRILRPGGWFAALWNHRDLGDPLQRRIERVIRDALPSYAYGVRREDQTAVIDASGAFGAVRTITAPIVHVQSVADVVAAWGSHATLHRQAGARFAAIVAAIARVLHDHGEPEIRVPYTTRVWMAQARPT
jgi:SAM-dependent methyltransferase